MEITEIWSTINKFICTECKCERTKKVWFWAVRQNNTITERFGPFDTLEEAAMNFVLRRVMVIDNVELQEDEGR